MADLSKIKLNDIIYNLKDSFARDKLPKIFDLVPYYDENENIDYYKTAESPSNIYNLIDNGYLVFLRNNDSHLYFYNSNERGHLIFISQILNEYVGHVCEEINSIDLEYNSNVDGYLWGINYIELDLPIPETMTNVISMLQEFGLDTTTTLEPGIADTAHADSLVLTQ